MREDSLLHSRRRALTHPWLLPPVWFIPFNVLLVMLDRGLPVYQLIDTPWSYLGWLPILLGSGICLVGLIQFRRQRTTIRPFHHSDALVRTGVYRFSRNPMYLGMVLAMLGVAINAGSLSALAVPPLFAVALYWGFIEREETALSERFGEEYTNYCRRVRRWL